ncbi:MAG: DUF3306 domain-containing protein [Croceibacterium sp.]
MTDRDESSKGFLERWSRKKIEAEREVPASAKADAQDVSPTAEVRLPGREAENNAQTPDKAAPKPEFNLASLPSLDSITAVTDIRAFLSPGVPADLARAALRRAWAADPAIRDFKGLAENDWDFTDPTAMPGFGALPPGTDIKKMLAQIFGGGEKPAIADAAKEKPSAPDAPGIAEQIAPPKPPAETASATAEEVESSPPEIATGGQQLTQVDFVQRDNNTALHNNSSDDEAEAPKSRRHHGGALPQ